MLLDVHHHFDFLTGDETRLAFLREIDARGVAVVAQTLTPSSFMELVRWAALQDDQVPLPRLSVGFHPWCIVDEQQAADELDVFSAALTMTRFVGEVGLDFSPRRLETCPVALQRDVFAEVLRRVRAAAGSTAQDEPFVLSIHAVRSMTDVLDLLDDLDLSCGRIVPVVHHFSGTSDELTRLVRAGGAVSVHPRMLASKRGRAYVRQIPADRLLLESDLPTGPVEDDTETAGRAAAAELDECLRATAAKLSEIRGVDMVDGIRHFSGLQSPVVAMTPAAPHA